MGTYAGWFPELEGCEPLPVSIDVSEVEFT